MGSRAVTTMAALAVGVMVPAPGAAVPPGATVLVSLPTGFEAPSDGASSAQVGGQAFSSSGRHVVFTSRSDALDATAEDNSGTHCYWRDTVTGETRVVDRATGAGGPVATTDCSNPAISADGAYVAFQSAAPNLVTGDTNDLPDVFVRTIGAATTRRVSVTAAGEELPQGATGPGGIAVASVPALRAVRNLFVTFRTQAAIDAASDSGSGRDVYMRRVGIGLAPTSTTALVSRGPGANGTASNDAAGGSISNDGRRIAFTSDTSLDPAAPGAAAYVRDTQANTTVIASRPTGTTDAAVFGAEPRISGDGGSVVFITGGPVLGGVAPPGAPPAFPTVYVRRLASNTTLPVSVVNGSSSLLAVGDGSVGVPAISDDGNRVAFVTTAANIGNGDTDGRSDVHVRDIALNTTTLASRADGPSGGAYPAPGPDGGFDMSGALSGDGDAVAFVAPPRGMAPGAGGDLPQAFVRRLAAGTTRLVSRPTGPDAAPFEQLVGSSATQAPSPVLEPSSTSSQRATRTVSRDGRWVVFTSNSDGLLPSPGSPHSQVFIRDLVDGRTRLVSATAAGAPGDGPSVDPTVTPDGATVAYVSSAPGITGSSVGQIVVWSRDTGVARIASVTPAGLPDPAAASLTPVLSDDGTKVAFVSRPIPAIPGSTAQVWLRDLPNQVTTLVSRANGVAGDPGAGSSIEPSISADGTKVAFASAAPNLDAADGNTLVDIFVRDLTTGTTTLASRADGRSGAPGDRGSRHPSIDAAGRRVAFATDATNLVALDTDVTSDIVVRDLPAGTTQLASRASGANGAKANADARSPLLSADGNRVVFTSAAGNLVVDDINARPDLFLRDLTAATTVGVSRVDGTTGTLLGVARAPAGASPDLACVAFESRDSILVGGGYRSRDFTQVYLRAIGECAAVRPPNATTPPRGTGLPFAPVVTRATLRPTRFRVGTRKGQGTTLRYTVSIRARVVITIERRVAGRFRDGRCRITATRGRVCARWLTAGRLVFTTPPGPRVRRFSGRLGGRPLPAGRYRLRIVPSAARLTGPTRIVPFRILAPRPR